MRILVVNGSPKGKYSVTLQTLLFLEKSLPPTNLSICTPGSR